MYFRPGERSMHDERSMHLWPPDASRCCRPAVPLAASLSGAWEHGAADDAGRLGGPPAPPEGSSMWLGVPPVASRGPPVPPPLRPEGSSMWLGAPPAASPAAREHGAVDDVDPRRLARPLPPPPPCSSPIGSFGSSSGDGDAAARAVFVEDRRVYPLLGNKVVTYREMAGLGPSGLSWQELQERWASLQPVPEAFSESDARPPPPPPPPVGPEHEKHCESLKLPPEVSSRFDPRCLPPRPARPPPLPHGDAAPRGPPPLLPFRECPLGRAGALAASAAASHRSVRLSDVVDTRAFQTDVVAEEFCTRAPRRGSCSCFPCEF